MSEWKGKMTINNGKLIIGACKTDIEAQLKLETWLNVLVPRNFGKVILYG